MDDLEKKDILGQNFEDWPWDASQDTAASPLAEASVEPMIETEAAPEDVPAEEPIVTEEMVSDAELVDELMDEPVDEPAELPMEQPLEEQPVYYACPVTPLDAAPAKKTKKKKERKARRGIGIVPVIAICVVCALIGGLLGGLLVKNAMGQAPMQADPAMESRIKALEEAAKRAPQQEAYDAQTVIPATEVYESNLTSVVGITNGATTTNIFGQSSSIASSGSGFIIREDGYVVTNYHVIQGAQTLSVTLSNGMEHPAKVIGYDSGMDVALLKIEAQGLEAVTVGDSDLLRVGDQVAAIGNPLGELTLTMTVGYISALDREINTDGIPTNMLQTDAAINSGNSGGPLFDMKGNVIGITTAKYSGSTSSGASIEGIGFAVPINDVMLIVNDLLEHGYISGRAYLGITAMDMDAQTAQVYSLPVGAYVNSVVDGSCAQKAGMQVRDIILALGEHEISSYADLSRALREFKPGEEADMKIYRAGAELTLRVIFDERPSEEEIAAREQQQAQADTPQPETQPMPDGGSGQGTIPYEFGQIPNGDVQDWFRYFFGG